MRPGSHDRRLIHVRPRDENALPDTDELRGWLDTVAAEYPAAETIRSAALFPRAAERFQASGFEIADRLALLRAELADGAVMAAMRQRDPRADGATRVLRRRHFAVASRIDRLAFGATWGHDVSELDDICHATPVHAARQRVFPAGWSLGGASGVTVAFAIAGASAEHGYLQRLAVDPGAQRHGHGRALTVDALRWMYRRRLPDCLVNTSVDNLAALALYASIGFTVLPEQLTVLQFDLRPQR